MQQQKNTLENRILYIINIDVIDTFFSFFFS